MKQALLYVVMIFSITMILFAVDYNMSHLN